MKIATFITTLCQSGIEIGLQSLLQFPLLPGHLIKRERHELWTRTLRSVSFGAVAINDFSEVLMLATVQRNGPFYFELHIRKRFLGGMHSVVWYIHIFYLFYVTCALHVMIIIISWAIQVVSYRIYDRQSKGKYPSR